MNAIRVSLLSVFATMLFSQQGVASMLGDALKSLGPPMQQCSLSYDTNEDRMMRGRLQCESAFGATTKEVILSTNQLREQAGKIVIAIFADAEPISKIMKQGVILGDCSSNTGSQAIGRHVGIDINPLEHCAGSVAADATKAQVFLSEKL